MKFYLSSANGGCVRVEMRDKSERIIIERIFSTRRDAEYYRGTLVTDDVG